MKKERTKKTFVDYNDYRDRPFGLKWGTAFAIDELNKVITDNKEMSMRVSHELPQMSRQDIDEVLQYAFLKSIKISIQLNIKDDYDRYEDNIIGSFKGFADSVYLYVDDQPIAWNKIRNVSLYHSDK